jgi:hypothetical protein
LGWLPAVVERWNPHARIRQDLYGFLDLVALDGEPGLLGIQATSSSNAASRVRKILELESDAPRRWLEAGNRIEVWGWKKLPNGRWECQARPIALDAL